MSVLINISVFSTRFPSGLNLFATIFSIIVGSYTLTGCIAKTTILPPASEHQNAPLRVGTSGDYAPFSLLLEGPTGPTGFSADLARAYAKATGRAVAWVPFRWPELAADLAGDRFDIALSGITVRPDRSILGRFSLPITTSGAVALVEESDSIRSIEDLRQPGLGISVNAGGHLERTTRAQFPSARIEAIPDNGRVLIQLEREDVRAVVTDTLEAPHWLAQRAGMRRIGPLTRDRKAAWFPAAGISEVRRFDEWLLRAEADGQLAELRADYELPETATATPQNALLASLDERLSLMIEVAAAKRILGSPIEDRPREIRVLDAAVAGIQHAAGLSDQIPPRPEAVRSFYVAQIEAAKSIQHAWTAEQPVLAEGPSTAAVDRAEGRLNREIRPALIDLGDRIAGLLVACASKPVQVPSVDEVAAALSRHALPPESISRLHAALVALLSPTAPVPASSPAPKPALKR